MEKRGRKKSVEEEEGEEVLKEREILNYQKAQSLRAFAALAEDSGSVPSTHIGRSPLSPPPSQNPVSTSGLHIHI